MYILEIHPHLHLLLHRMYTFIFTFLFTTKENLEAAW